MYEVDDHIYKWSQPFRNTPGDALSSFVLRQFQRTEVLLNASRDLWPDHQLEKELSSYNRDQLSYLEVAFNLAKKSIITEAETYPLINLCSNVGGVLGLWIGSSVLVVAELVVVFHSVFTVCCPNAAAADDEMHTRADSERISRRKIVKKFVECTSMHGLNHLIVSRTSKMRLFWGLVLLGALAGLIMHSQTVAALYMSRPISIEMQYSLDKEPLPAITVCPSSLTSYYHLYLKKRGLSAFNWNLLTDWNLARLLETALTPFWKQIYGLQMSMLNISDHKDRNFNMPLDVQLFRYASIVDSFAQFLSQLKYQNVTRNRAHNMIFACEFSYQLCNFTSFTLTYHPIYKTCFTYRYSPANHRLGFPEFLSLITLANDIPEYSRGFNSAPINMYRGGVFEVHSFETAPTMTQPYPFTKAYRQLVAITKTEDRIVNSALYPCLDQSDTEKIVLVEESIRFDGNETANETSYRYSHELCQQLQLQATVIERCHCVSPLLPVSKQQQQQLSRGTNVIFKCGRMPATLLRNGISFSQNSSDFFVTVSEGDATSTTAKLLDYLDSVEGGRHFLDSLVCQTKTLINDTVKQRSRQRCLERCNKISYKLKLNSNTFDHFYETYAMINLFNNHFTLTNINGPLEHVFDYYIRAYFSTAYVFQRLSAFYFYFKSSETKTVTQTDSYTLTSMLSDLGGVLGLWFGVSIATVFELLELAIMLFVYRT